MKIILFTGLLFTVLPVSASLAEGLHQHHQLTQHGSMDHSNLIDGVVSKVDMKRQKITLKHGDIPQIQMPAMVMNYQVSDANLLVGLNKGDRVRFAMDKVGGEFVVTHIERAD